MSKKQKIQPVKINKYQKTNLVTSSNQKKSPSEKKNPLSHQAWLTYKREKNQAKQAPA